MMDEALSRLYQGAIAEHNRAPRFFEKRPGAMYIIDAFNPMCGDKFKLYIDVENEVIVRATFHGYGCAVSKASASVLMGKIQGLPLSKLPEIISPFLETVATGVETNDPETAAFAMAKNFPGREKCATLAWEAMEEIRNWEIGN